MEHTAGRISQGWLAVRQRCDNMGVVGASDKALSLKRPLADVLQSTTIFCARHHVQLHISHIAGERNDWADWLSRGRSKNPKWWSLLSAVALPTVGQLMRGWLWDDFGLATAMARALFGELCRGLLPACQSGRGGQRLSYACLSISSQMVKL